MRRAALSTDGEAAQALGSWSNRRGSAVPEGSGSADRAAEAGSLAVAVADSHPLFLPRNKKISPRLNQRIAAAPPPSMPAALLSASQASARLIVAATAAASELVPDSTIFASRRTTMRVDPRRR